MSTLAIIVHHGWLGIWAFVLTAIVILRGWLSLAGCFDTVQRPFRVVPGAESLWDADRKLSAGIWLL
jgi:hypothetical protein